MAKGHRPTQYEKPDRAYREWVLYCNQVYYILPPEKNRRLLPTYEAIGVPNRAMSATHEFDGLRWHRNKIWPTAPPSRAS